MNRVFVAAFVATAVVGATSGTLVARSLDRVTDAERAAATDRLNPASDDDSGPGETTTSQDDRADQVLWATTRAIHDGTTVVELERDLDTDDDGDFEIESAPVALQRAAGGWVFNIDLANEASETQAFFVSPDGAVRAVARVTGFGDVSPDGRRYAALSLDGEGYGVWDLASGDRVASVSTGRRAGQRPTGVAQFVDTDTLATAWSREGGDEVLRSTLGSYELEVVADDVVGPWAVSPDGRWFAGTLSTVAGGEVGPGCVVVRPLDGSDDGRTDCGGEFFNLGEPPLPSYASDSSMVVTVQKDVGFVGGPSFGDPNFRPVPTGDRPVPARIPAPAGATSAVALGTDSVAVLGPKDLDSFEQTRIHVCAESGGCRLMASSKDDSFMAVLGTAY